VTIPDAPVDPPERTIPTHAIRLWPDPTRDVLWALQWDPDKEALVGILSTGEEKDAEDIGLTTREIEDVIGGLI